MARGKKVVQPKSKAPNIAVLETVFAGLGAILAAGTLGIILWKGLAGSDGSPAVEARVTRVEAQGGGHLAEIEVFNGGDVAAAGLEVEGTLERDGETVETAATTFDYVPSQSRRRGGLYFTEDPKTGTLKVAPKSYVMP
jgi:uncharacterized protein (TIGR02588 family)